MYTNKTTNQNYQLTTNHENANYRSAPIDIPHSRNRSNRLYIHNPLRRNRGKFIDANLSNSIGNGNNTISASIESPSQRVGSSTFYVESESSEALSSIPTESSNYSINEDIYGVINLPPSSQNGVTSFDEVNRDLQFEDNPNYTSFDKENIPQRIGSSTFYVGSKSSEAFSSIPTESSNHSPDDHIYETINLPSSSQDRIRSFNGVDHEIQFDDNPYYFSLDEEDIPPEVPLKKSNMFLEDNPRYEIFEESLQYMRERFRDHTEFREKYCKI